MVSKTGNQCTNIGRRVFPVKKHLSFDNELVGDELTCPSRSQQVVIRPTFD